MVIIGVTAITTLTAIIPITPITGAAVAEGSVSSFSASPPFLA